MSEHDDTEIPLSERDTGKIRTGIDALAGYVAAVDFLTGEVHGLSAAVANLPTADAIRTAAALGAAEGVANAVLEFSRTISGRIEATERKLAEFELACANCRTVPAPTVDAFSLRPDHVSLSLWHKVKYKGSGAIALAAIVTGLLCWVAVSVVEAPKTSAETRKSAP
jgi:hypothetical protein